MLGKFESRVQAKVAMDLELLEGVIDIKKTTGAASVEEVLGNAVMLYSLVTHSSCKEVKIQIERSSGKKEVITLKELLQAKDDPEWRSWSQSHSLPLMPKNNNLR